MDSISSDKVPKMGGILPEHITLDGDMMVKYGDYIDLMVHSVIEGIVFKMKAKKINKHLEEAADTLNDAEELFSIASDKFAATEKALTERTKRSASKLKDTTHKLGLSLRKIEAQANFAKLEEYAATLERIETAMSSLAKLEASGVLSKITTALK